jgi:multiple sugar transport system substrate-binding protein
LHFRNSLYNKELAIFSGGILPKPLETQPGFPEVSIILIRKESIQMKNLAKIAAVTVSVLLLFCMNLFAGGAAQDSRGAGESPVIFSWTWDQEKQEAMLAAYNTAHPGSQLKQEMVIIAAQDYLPKLQSTAASGGKLPDILGAEMGQRGALYSMDIWERLDAAPYNLDTSIFIDAVIGGMKNAKGEVIALENALNPAGMAYKRDVAKQYLGTDDSAALEAMFKDYGAYSRLGAEVYQKSGGKVTLFIGLRDVADMMSRQVRNISNLDAGGNINVSGKMRKIFEVIKSVQVNHGAGNIVSGTPAWNAAIGQKSFIFFPCASWAPKYQIVPNDPNGKGNWGIFVPAGGPYGSGGTSFGLSKTTNFKKEAYDFLLWTYTSKPAAEALKREQDMFLPVKALYSDPAYATGTTEWFSSQDLFKILYVDYAPVVPPPAITVYDNMVTDSMNMVVDSLNADPSLTVDRMMDMYMKDLQQKIQDKKVL